jgi:UDP-2,3-diacylglucosamine pyrophosphatase LpxH
VIKIIVVSDVHLGSARCDKAAFNAFLSSLRDDDEVTDLVLLGDIVEMWHRDASGLFLENMDTMQIIKDLKERMTVHWVAGNHDYHLLKLKNRAPHYNYPFEFKNTLELVDRHHTYRFLHGYEFEYGKELPLMKPVWDMLCHVMSDSDGVTKGERWASVTRKLSDLQYTIFTQHSENSALGRSLEDGPEERLKDRLGDIEKLAYAATRDKPGELLVFGHTHDAFINKEEDLVNSGSWVKDAPMWN